MQDLRRFLLGFMMAFHTTCSFQTGSRHMFRPIMTMKQPNPVIKAASAGMGLLKPVFVAEANIQAAVLGGLADVSDADVELEIEEAKKNNPILIYTYGLSPFSSEAIALLDSSGFEYKKIELGLEWFLLGGRGSKTRTALGRMVDSGATSLPKVFIGGKPLGGASGYSALAESLQSGELQGLLQKSGAKRTK